MFFIWITLIFSGGPNLYAASNPPALGPCDSWFTATSHPRGVVLLTHGMNLKPSRMDELAQLLAQSGFEVFRPAFKGHCDKNKEYLDISADQWEADAKRFHAIAQRRAKNLKRPLYLVAYSFSALVFQVQAKELPFAKRIYFAPALSLKFWYPMVAWAAQQFPSYTYASRVPPGYRANEISGASAIVALEEFHRRWRGGAGRGDSTPILMFASTKDELVNYDGLQTVVADKNNWLLEIVSTEKSLPQGGNHLFIDQGSAGPEAWSLIKERALNFLQR